MTRLIFVNLPVADLAAAREFYLGLGFRLNERFSDEQVACIVVSETILVMLLVRARFADFTVGPIADGRLTTEVINCLSAGSREEVDTMVTRALAAGGRPWREPIAEGPMYGHSFADPDGHVWEIMHMAR